MVDAAITKDIGAEAKDYDECLTTVKALTIESPADFEFASELVKNARANWKRLEARRTALTKPLNAAKRGIDDLFKRPLETLKAIEDTLKDKIGAYTTAEREKQREALDASAAQYAAGQVPTVPIAEVPHAQGISVSETWDFEIENPAEVPREYCSPDPDKIKQVIWYADTPRTAPRPIPGIRFFLKTSTVVRVKSG